MKTPFATTRAKNNRSQFDVYTLILQKCHAQALARIGAAFLNATEGAIYLMLRLCHKQGHNPPWDGIHTMQCSNLLQTTKAQEVDGNQHSYPKVIKKQTK
eukprot:2239784-Amphidinium_carterae.1